MFKGEPQIWVSINRLKVHEFWQTLRHIKAAGETWSDIYLRLGELQNEAWKNVGKALSGSFILYLLLSTLGDANTVSITIKDITAAVSASYVALFGSVSAFFSMLTLISAFSVMKLKIDWSTRHGLRNFSPNSFGFYRKNDQEELSLSISSTVTSHMKETFPVSGFLSFGLLATLFVTALPVLSLWWYFLTLNGALITSSQAIFDQCIAIVGLFISIFTVVYLLAIYLPLPWRKDAFSIRWGILSRMYPVGGHPRVEHWLSELEESEN